MRYCLKLDREHDAYVLFSTVVDGIVSDVLTRDEMFHQLLKHGGPEELIEAALVHADLSGSSSQVGEYGYDDGPILFLNGGASDIMIPRDQLYTYVVYKTPPLGDSW